MRSESPVLLIAVLLAVAARPTAYASDSNHSPRAAGAVAALRAGDAATAPAVPLEHAAAARNAVSPAAAPVDASAAALQQGSPRPSRRAYKLVLFLALVVAVITGAAGG